MNEEIFQRQLAYIHQRLESLPHANHEAQALNDCLRLLIRTLYGEILDLGHQVVGGGHILPQDADVRVYQNHQRQGGVELAPGVVQYDANTQRAGGMTKQTIPGMPGGQPPMASIGGAGALIDVQAQLGMARPGAGAAGPNSEPAIQPVPGSLMHTAMMGGAIGPGGEPILPEGIAVAEPVPQPQPETPTPPMIPRQASGDPVGDTAAAEMEALLGDAPVDPADTQLEVK